MPAGVLQTVLVCQESPTPSAPCPAGQAPAAMQAYVVYPASASYLDAVAEPFDYATGAAFWSAAFVFTLSLYILARIYGSLISMVR